MEQRNGQLSTFSGDMFISILHFSETRVFYLKNSKERQQQTSLSVTCKESMEEQKKVDETSMDIDEDLDTLKKDDKKVNLTVAGNTILGLCETV
jgi:hypothetical protein